MAMGFNKNAEVEQTRTIRAAFVILHFTAANIDRFGFAAACFSPSGRYGSQRTNWS